ncbi:MAG: glycosyltransferase family 4 protein [bacterium]|nr:glycosyltransferase family 4 protein [bacterium]
MRKLLYINNRYRHYDRIKYETLGRNFDLRVLWIGPPPPGEAPSSELLGLFHHEILDSETESKLQPWHVLRTIRLGRRVADLAREADLVVSSTSDSWKSKVAFVAASRRRTPIAFRKERWLDVSLPRLTRPYWLLDQLLTDFIETRARGMLVGGRKAREYLLSKGHGPESVLPFSYLHDDLSTREADPEGAAELRDFAGDSLLLLYLGRIMPQKGLDVLITVVRELLEEGENPRLLIVGEPIARETGRGVTSLDYHDRCLQLADNDSRIRFCGAVPADRVHEYYRAADVFVHPHTLRVGDREKHDGWGNVITEAASLSTPVVASDRVGSAFDIVEDGVSGFLLRSTRLENDLRRALIFFCRNRGAVSSFGQEARRRYEHTVNAERTVSSVRRLMEPGSVRGEGAG